MATVYLAEDLKHGRKVAIKVLHPELSAVIGGERFLSEIKTTASLQHPHILGLIDSGAVPLTTHDSRLTDDSRLSTDLLYYVMPFIEGETLRGRLTREKQLPVEDSIRLTKEVAAALEFAHKRGIIHRDIKPENILLQDGQALVADFGIALAVQQAGGSRMTQTGMSLGTPAYMSPEQAMGERDIGARSDVYALGAMTYEMLAGEPPFMGPNSQAIVAKVLTEQPPLLRPRRPLVSSAVENAVLTALQKLPADRFNSAKDYADALDGKGGTYAATVLTPGSRPSRPSRLSRPVIIAAAALIATAAGLAGWLARGSSRAAPVLRYALDLPATQPMETSRIGVNIDLSPDGSKFVYVAPSDEGGRLWLRHRDRLDATPITGSENAINPRFSPDGRQLAFSSGSLLDLKVVALDGGAPATIARGGNGASGGVAWSDDGWIYFDAIAGLSRVRPNGDSVQLVVRIDAAHGEAGQAWPEPVPGGRWLAYRTRHSNAPEEFDIGVTDLRNGARHVLTKGVLARRIEPGLWGIVRADGALTVARVDEGTMTLKGTLVPVVDGIRTKLLGSVDLTTAAGTLMYVRGVNASAVSVRALWVARNGATRDIEPPIVVTPANNRGLAISPDGRRLVVDMVGPRSTDLWVKELPTGPFSRLTFDGLENTRPSWMPDGQSVLYIRNDGAGTNNTTQVWRKRADGSAPAESVFATSRSIAEALVSRNGEWLIYRINSDSGGDIYGLRLGRDTTPVPLVAGPFAEGNPALSPDGRWLAYVTNESGNLEVYVRPFPDVSRGRWQVSTGGGSAPRWARSGKELFYVNVGDMMSVPVTTTATTFAAGTPRKLFSGFGTQFLQGIVPYYDTSLDDQEFLMMGIPAGDSTRSQLVTVENWLQDVDAKLAAAR
jgi:serine/threonine protein kinase/Tol biopolymer transport system component